MFDKKKNAAESYGVIGLGRFGTALVKTLAAAGKEVIAVDKDEAKVKAVRGYTDYAFVIDELNETSLKETGMQNCKARLTWPRQWGIITIEKALRQAVGPIKNEVLGFYPKNRHFAEWRFLLFTTMLIVMVLRPT